MEDKDLAKDPLAFLDVSPIGRKPIVLSGGPSIEQMVETYRTERSLRRASSKLGISVSTLQKYLHLVKENLVLGRTHTGIPWKTRYLGGVATWVHDRTAPLPRSVREIVRLSGFTRDQVYAYFKRRRRAAVEFLKSLGDLRTIPEVTLTDIRGRRIPTGMFSQYELFVDKFNLVVSIEATMKFGGKATFRLPFARYRELLGEMPPKT